MTQYGHPLPYLLLYTLPPIALTLIVHPLLPLLVPESILSFIPLPTRPEFPALQANIGFALLAFVGSVLAVPYVGKAFIEKGLKGRDLLKPGGRTDGPWV
jgi:UDP-N-acetylglucosamine--dolichyl-phosphate N-acetylglucosaminephosphotransferase